MNSNRALGVTSGLGGYSSGGGVNGISDLIDLLTGYIFSIDKILYMLVFVLFFWGVVKFLFSDQIDKENGKNLMVWGVIGIFILTAIWGIVSFIQNSVGVKDNNNVSSIQEIAPEL